MRLKSEWIEAGAQRAYATHLGLMQADYVGWEELDEASREIWRTTMITALVVILPMMGEHLGDVADAHDSVPGGPSAAIRAECGPDDTQRKVALHGVSP